MKQPTRALSPKYKKNVYNSTINNNNNWKISRKPKQTFLSKEDQMANRHTEKDAQHH